MDTYSIPNFPQKKGYWIVKRILDTEEDQTSNDYHPVIL